MHDDVEETPDIVERAGGEGWLVGGQCMIYEFLDHFGLDEAMQDYEFTDSSCTPWSVCPPWANVSDGASSPSRS